MRDEREEEVQRQLAGVLGEGRVEPVEVAAEPRDPGQGHQQAHAVLRPLPPRDGPGRNERPADRDVHRAREGQRIGSEREPDREEPEDGSQRRQGEACHVRIVSSNRR